MDVQVALTKGVMAKMLKRHTKFSSGVRKKSCGNSSVFLDGRSPSDSKSHYDLLSKSRDGLKQIKVEKVTGRIPTEGPVNIPLSVWFPKKQRPHTANERQFHPEHNKNMSHEDVPTTGAPQSRKRSNSIIVKAEEPSEGRGSSNSSLVPLPILPTQGGHRANGFRISRPCSAELPQRRSGVKLIPTGYGGRVRRQQGHKGVGRNTMKISSAELVPRKDLPCEGNRYRISGRDQLMSTNVLSGDHPVYYVTADGQLAQVVKNEQQISKKGCDIETQTAVPIKSKEGFGKEEKPTEEKKPDQNTYTDNQGTNRKEQPYHPSRGVQQQQEMYYEPLERDGRDSRMASRNFCGQGGDASPRMGRLSQHIVFAKQWDVPLDSSTGRYPSGDFSPSSRHPNHLGQRHGCFEMSCSPSILMDQETFVSPKCSSYSSRPTTWRECENFCREGNVSRDVFKDEFPGERFAVSSSSSDHCIYGKDQFHRQKPRLQNAYHRLTEAVLKEFQLQQVQQFLSEKRCGVTPPKLKSFKHKRVKAIPMYCTGTHEEDLVAIDPSECRDCVQTKRRSPLDSKPLSKTKVKELVTLGGDPSPKDSRERLEKLEETGVPVSPYTTFPKDKSFVDVKDRESSISAALIREFPLKSDSLIHSATDVPDKIMKGERSGIEMQPGQKELCEKQSSLGRPSIKLTVKGSKDFGSSHSLDAPQYKLSREHLVSEDYGLRSKELSADYGLGSKDPAANAIGYEYGDFLKHETRQSTQGRKSSIYNKGEIPLDAQSLEVSKLRDSQRFSEPEQQFQPHQHRQSLAYPRSVQRFQSQRLQSQEYSQSEQRLQSQQHLQSRKQPEPHQHMNEPDRVSVPMESRDEETEPVNEILYPPQCTPQKPCDDSWGPMSKPNQTPRLRRRSYFYRKCVLGGMPLEGPHERARPKYQGNSGDSQSKTERSYERVQGEKQGQCCRKAPNRPASQQGPESRQNTLFRNGEKVENWNDCLCFRQPRPRGLPRIARGDALKKYFPLWCNYDSADADAEDTDMANNSSAEVLRKLYLNRDRTLVSFSSQPAGESAPESAQAISGGVVDKTESHKEETQSEEKPPLRYKKRSKKKSQDSTLSEKAVHDQQPKMTMATSSRNLQEQPNQDNLEGTSSMQWNIDDNENKTDQIDLQNERFCRILNPSSERKTAWVSSTKRPERSRLHRKSIKEKSKKPEEDLEGNQEKKHSIVGKDQKEKKPQRDSQENVEEAESSQVVLKTSSLKKVNKSANQQNMDVSSEAEVYDEQAQRKKSASKTMETSGVKRPEPDLKFEPLQSFPSEKLLPEEEDQNKARSSLQSMKDRKGVENTPPQREKPLSQSKMTSYAEHLKSEENPKSSRHATPVEEQDNDLVSSETKTWPADKQKGKQPNRRYFKKKTQEILRNKKQAANRILTGKHPDLQNNFLEMETDLDKLSGHDFFTSDDETLCQPYSFHRRAKSIILSPYPYGECALSRSNSFYKEAAFLGCRTEEESYSVPYSERQNVKNDIYFYADTKKYKKNITLENPHTTSNTRAHRNFINSLRHVAKEHQASSIFPISYDNKNINRFPSDTSIDENLVKQYEKRSLHWADSVFQAPISWESKDQTKICRFKGQSSKLCSKVNIKARSKSVDIQCHRDISQNQLNSPENEGDYVGHERGHGTSQVKHHCVLNKERFVLDPDEGNHFKRDENLRLHRRAHSANGVGAYSRSDSLIYTNMSENKSGGPRWQKSVGRGALKSVGKGAGRGKSALKKPKGTGSNSQELVKSGDFKSVSPPISNSEEKDPEKDGKIKTASSGLRNASGSSLNELKQKKDDENSVQLSTTFEDAVSVSEAKTKERVVDPNEEKSQRSDPNETTKYQEIRDNFRTPEKTGSIDKKEPEKLSEGEGGSLKSQNTLDSKDRQPPSCAENGRPLEKCEHKDDDDCISCPPPEHTTSKDNHQNGFSPCINSYRADRLEFDPGDQRSPKFVIPLGSTSTSRGVKSFRKTDLCSTSDTGPASTEQEVSCGAKCRVKGDLDKREFYTYRYNKISSLEDGKSCDSSSSVKRNRAKHRCTSSSACRSSCKACDDDHSDRQIPTSTRRSQREEDGQSVKPKYSPSLSSELCRCPPKERYPSRARYQADSRSRKLTPEDERRPRSRSYSNEIRKCTCGFCYSKTGNDEKDRAKKSQSSNLKYYSPVKRSDSVSRSNQLRPDMPERPYSGKDVSEENEFWRGRRQTLYRIPQDFSPSCEKPRESKPEAYKNDTDHVYPFPRTLARPFYQSQEQESKLNDPDLSCRAGGKKPLRALRSAQPTGTHVMRQQSPIFQSQEEITPALAIKFDTSCQSPMRSARATRKTQPRNIHPSAWSPSTMDATGDERWLRDSQRHRSSSKRQRRASIKPPFHSNSKHRISPVAYVDQFNYDDSGYVKAGTKKPPRVGRRKISFMGLKKGHIIDPPLRTDDEPSKQAEKPTPPGSLIFQLAARYATFGGIRVAGGVRVLMDAPEKMGYVQIVSPLGQPFITHYINTMSFLQSASAAGVAWSAVIWDHAEEEAPKSKRPGRHGASDDHVVGKVDSAQVIFCEPYQAHRFRAVLETIKAAFSGGDGALVTPNVPPIPPACGRFNSCNPCLDLCNPGSCAVPCTPQQPLPTFPALPDPCGNPCQLPYPPLHQDPCGGNGVTACCAPPCCPPQPCFPQPSAPCAPPPFCTQLCCPPEPSCMPPCTNPCPIPLPTSCPGQCPTPNCCPDDCDPYAFANAYGKTLFCQLGCLVKLGKDEVWLEMNRGCVMVIQEPHCMGFSLALVNDKQVVLAVQKLSRKTDFKESPHTQHGFLYTAVSTTEKGSLHENFLVSFQSKAHADQFRNVVSGIKRVMAMSAGNISNSARITGISVCAPGVLRSCFDDVVETNDELRARMWDSCNMDGPCGVHRGGADPCEGGRDYSRRHDPSGGYKGSCGFESTGRGAPYNPHFDHKAKGYEYRFVGPRGFKHGHGRDNGRIGLHWDTGRLGNIAKMYGNGPEKGPGAKPGDAKTVSRQAGFANTADPASAAPASAAPASPEPKSEPVTVVPAKSTSQLTTTA